MYLDLMTNATGLLINGYFFVTKFIFQLQFLFKYFCTGSKSNEINLVPELQNCGMWNDLIAAVNLVAYHANSLIHNVNNNYVEGYNSIVAKYVRGKRINFSFKGI